ncbi:type 1 glutamine amidotransferase [Natrarchaeobaculum aegyptiacum]|uniref:GMP synthase n=1 Tax=Natrarchaeobaculum aegyptiacum TaxID=745377 RepID=A0A2Z2HWD0_9EURY|nr:gamma-glutamyl-gamma-aminobutyrate hydrolase family protein [Natrarchaeobaculum aegyptiacum]ARS89234.1 GMP synthase [Natrarchaeobaculum aegyptiacum]
MAPPRLVVVHNEVDSDATFHCEALEGALPATSTIAVDYPAGERPALGSADGVVLSGSTAGVYEVGENPWIDEQQALVRELIERRIPTLGVCFGHQLVNAALGGTVEADELRCRPVAVEFADDSLFRNVSSVVPAVHGDVVTHPGDDLEVIASAEHARVFATRHREAPLWTVQFHPELTAAHRDRLEAAFPWREGEHGLEEVTASRVLENFVNFVTERAGRANAE